MLKYQRPSLTEWGPDQKRRTLRVHGIPRDERLITSFPPNHHSGHITGISFLLTHERVFPISFPFKTCLIFL